MRVGYPKMIRTGAAAACLLLLAVCVWWLVHPPLWLDPTSWLVLMGVTWLLFAAGAWLIWGAPKRAAVVLILIGGVGLPLAAGFAPPRSSDDLYRYIWDGRVQRAGIDPYRYAPAAPELVGLRDPFLWPEESAWCVEPGSTDRAHGRPQVEGCSMINRPTVHTIYPPAAQLYFRIVDALSPPDAGVRPIQWGAALFAVAVTVLLVVVLPRSGIDPRRVVLWAWCPFVALETGNNAHLDVVAAFLTVAALLVYSRARDTRRTVVSGALFGLAVGVKFTPVLTGPALLRRRPLLFGATAAAVLVLVYLPHVLAVGPGVLGYLPGYLGDEGYLSGGRFALLTILMPQGLATVVAAVILGVTAILVWRRSDPDRPWDAAVTMVGVALLIATPGYSWYALLLVALAAMSARPIWVVVALAGYVAQYALNLHITGIVGQRLGYGLAALLIVVVAVSRRRALPFLRMVR